MDEQRLPPGVYLKGGDESGRTVEIPFFKELRPTAEKERWWRMYYNRPNENAPAIPEPKKAQWKEDS